jgi:hypothetical protein
MDESQITLSGEERACLVELLQSALKNRRVEEHRTRAPTYREQILEQEKLLENMLAKLGQPVT